ncbi:hypothetical protein ABB27_09210 [Stenotrophomonas terrae]|uniref:DUF11 domain-containing protein n=1 Tax=Stenotrophomonas terrae TaxID=405446 RepID=A0A0R0CQ17_9GAMM|nr:DUF11 domain-containing protein [Stenotrophomonas terrae]KRG67729.1 hypothetical protein ABB27_09210 [Stenotrophomonas terrae]
MTMTRMQPLPRDNARPTVQLQLYQLLALWLLLLALATQAKAQTSAGAEAGDGGVLLTVSNSPALGAADLADDHYRPGSDITYQLRATNNGTAAFRGRLQSKLPAGITQAHWACLSDGGARCPSAQGSGAVDAMTHLPAGSSVTYQLTISVPADYPDLHPLLELEAALQPVEGSAAPRLSARDSDSAQADAGLPAPTAPTSTPSPGSVADRNAAPRASGGLQSSSGGLRSGLGAPRLLGLGGPFSQCSPDMFISQAASGQDNTTLSRVDTSSVPFTLIPLGTGSVPYNAVGYRPADNFLYGIRIGNTNLVRIHSDGSTEVLGAVSGLPAPTSPPVNNSYNAGEIGTDGFLYVKTQNVVSAIYRIDLTTLPGTATRINLIGGTVSGADLAWINGRLYTVNQNGTVAWIDPGTGQVTTLPVANGALGNVGALFGTPTALYGSRNDPGGFYEFDLTTGAGTRLSGSPVVGSNDGAHCASAEIVLGVDVGVSKTNTPAQGPNDLPSDTYLPGTNVVYTIVVSNRGPVGVQNLRVRDALPPGISTASWTCQITQGEGECGQSSGTGAIDDQLDLEFDETNRIVSQATYTLTMAVPLAYPQSHAMLTNTATITPPTSYTDATPNDNSATDTDPAPQTDLSVVKTTPSASVRIGDTISYTLTASNLGPADVSNAVLSDTPNGRLDCLSPSTPPTCSATGAASCPVSLSRAALFGTGVIIPSLPANNGTVLVTVSCLVIP